MYNHYIYALRELTMANNTTNSAYARPEKQAKFWLGKLFTDASVKTEPEEPQKIVVAGLAEARLTKEYPDTFFGRAAAVMRGELSLLFRSTLYFLIFAIPFIVIFAWFAGYFETNIVNVGGNNNFMGDIGIGFPGGGDVLATSVASLYRNVRMPVVAMYAACLLFGSLGFSGLFYCAKRSYYQNYYKNFSRQFWYGFAKYWWKFFVAGLFMTVVGLGMVEALFYLLEQQTLGTAGAGAYCAVVFSWVLGIPLLAIPMIMMGLFTSYDLTFAQCFKNALVIIANNAVFTTIVGVLSAAPLALLSVNKTLGVIISIAMALIGCTFMALCWIALADRGMVKCHNKKVAQDKTEKYEQRKAAKQNPYANGAQKAQNAGQKKKNQPAKPYQNPKKKKKK